MTSDVIKYAIHKTNPKVGEAANRFKLGFDNLTKDEAADFLMVLAKMQNARAEGKPWAWPYEPHETLQMDCAPNAPVTMPEFLDAADNGFAGGDLTYPIPGRDGNHLHYWAPDRHHREGKGEDQ